jgi:hypothetical protein
LTLGAGFFALSVTKGRAGNLRQSIFFATLAAIIGLFKAIDDGADDGDFFAIFCIYALLSVSAVLISRQLHQASRKRKEPE